MLWPTPGDYERVIQFFYSDSVLDSQLIRGQPQQGRNSRLKLYTGNFSVTFPIEIRGPTITFWG